MVKARPDSGRIYWMASAIRVSMMECLCRCGAGMERWEFERVNTAQRREGHFSHSFEEPSARPLRTNA